MPKVWMLLQLLAKALLDKEMKVGLSMLRGGTVKGLIWEIFIARFGMTAKQTWLGAFTQKLVDNVQISIENIHLRYEDNLSTPEVSCFSQ